MPHSRITQEIIRANAQVTTAADLSTKYRKNVQYNLDVYKAEAAKDRSTTQ